MSWLLPKSWVPETIDLQLKVEGHDFLDDCARVRIVRGSAFAPLTSQEESGLLKNLTLGNVEVVKKMREAAVIINREWRVTIIADELLQCVSAMVIFLDTMHEELDFKFTTTEIQRGDAQKDGMPLYKAIERVERRKVTARIAETVLASIIAGLVLCVVVDFAIGGIVP